MILAMIGTTELLLIGGLALLLFGGKKLPEMMRGLGQGVREFKKGVNGVNPDTENNPENSESDDNLENPKDGEKQE
jgi:sec-independent protein translocase protein TatA